MSTASRPDTSPQEFPEIGEFPADVGPSPAPIAAARKLSETGRFAEPAVAEQLAAGGADAVAVFLAELRHDLDVVMLRLDAMDGPQPAPPGFEPLKLAAWRLGISTETLRRRAAARAIPSVRIGGKWHVDARGIEESTPRPDGARQNHEHNI
jgi:hypothetical protein